MSDRRLGIASEQQAGRLCSTNLGGSDFPNLWRYKLQGAQFNLTAYSHTSLKIAAPCWEHEAYWGQTALVNVGQKTKVKAYLIDSFRMRAIRLVLASAMALAACALDVGVTVGSACTCTCPETRDPLRVKDQANAIPSAMQPSPDIPMTRYSGFVGGWPGI